MLSRKICEQHCRHYRFTKDINHELCDWWSCFAMHPLKRRTVTKESPIPRVCPFALEHLMEAQNAEQRDL